MSDDSNFTRVLGRWDVLAVAFGAMIGFGWIVLTGGFLQDAGTLGAALAFVIGGVIMALVGLTYAELVSAMPKAGGEHNYVLRGLGSRAAFVTSWSLVLGYVSVVAFEAVALPQTMLYLAPDMLVGKMWTVADYDVYASWVAVGVVGALLVTGLNYIGVRPAAVFQGVAVLFLLAVGALLLVGSVVGGSSDNLAPLFTGGFGGLVAVLVAVPFLFVGFDVIPQSAEEINLPFRQIGKLVVVSVLAAATFYIVVMVTVGSSLPKAELAASELSAADGMAALWGSEVFGKILVVGGIAGILTSWNGFLLGASRLLYAMAASGMVPRLVRARAPPLPDAEQRDPLHRRAVPDRASVRTADAGLARRRRRLFDHRRLLPRRGLVPDAAPSRAGHGATVHRVRRPGRRGARGGAHAGARCPLPAGNARGPDLAGGVGDPRALVGRRRGAGAPAAPDRARPGCRARAVGRDRAHRDRLRGRGSVLRSCGRCRRRARCPRPRRCRWRRAAAGVGPQVR